MIHKMLFMALLILGCTGCESYFDPGPRIRRDQALIDDLIALDLPRIARGNDHWFFGRITLNKDAYKPASHVSPDGKVVRMEVSAAGTCVVLDNLGQAPLPTTFDFHFDNARVVWARGGPRGRPFMLVNGDFLLRFNPALPENNLGRLPEGYLFPDDTWVPEVDAAWKYVRGHFAIFDSAVTSRETLSGLARGNNPVLAIAAFRKLAEAHLIDPPMAFGLIMATKCPTQGALMYDYLRTLDEDSAEAAVGLWAPFIKNAKVVEEIEGIALAAPSIIQYESPAGYKAAVRLRNEIKNRLEKLKGDPQMKEGLTNLYHREMFGRD